MPHRDAAPPGEGREPRKPPPTGTRYPGIDTLRGLAIVLMIVYHFSYDLTLFGVLRIDFSSSPGWIAFRAVILSLFFLTAGISLRLAALRPDFARAFWRRLAWVAGAAVLVSIVSIFLFPARWIYFGVLHAIALASLLGLPLVRRPRLALAVGLVAIAAGITLAFPVFDARALNFVGMMTTKPPTEDYVPLLPWFGVLAIGIALAERLRRHEGAAFRGLDRAAVPLLGLLGRHGLAVYLIHQPILIGLLYIALR